MESGRLSFTIAVVGGGFSGLLTAVHLLAGGPEVTVRLIERAPIFGRGRAYATDSPQHLLNVRAANMSAFPGDPGHFLNWLAACGEGGDGFVPRGLYGDYLQDLLRETVSTPRSVSLPGVFSSRISTFGWMPEMPEQVANLSRRCAKRSAAPR